MAYQQYQQIGGAGLTTASEMASSCVPQQMINVPHTHLRLHTQTTTRQWPTTETSFNQVPATVSVEEVQEQPIVIGATCPCPQAAARVAVAAPSCGCAPGAGVAYGYGASPAFRGW